MIQIPKQTGQATGTIVQQNIVDAFARCWAPSRATAVWLVNTEAEKQCIQASLAVGTAGGALPLYVPTNNPDVQPYNLMLGRPVIPIEQAPVPGTPGDVVLADFSRYSLAFRQTMQAVVSIHVNFNTDENVFRFTTRVGGQPIDTRPITPLTGTLTVSPFVCIAQR
jgi:HK97 family phage major capsid protein